MHTNVDCLQYYLLASIPTSVSFLGTVFGVIIIQNSEGGGYVMNAANTKRRPSSESLSGNGGPAQCCHMERSIGYRLQRRMSALMSRILETSVYLLSEFLSKLLL